VSNQRIFSLTLCVALCVFALAALHLLAGGPASAQITTRYVATTGADSGDCTDPNNPCRTVQYAVDRADSGDVVKVAAGIYTDLNSHGGQSQVVYITKTVTIRGGYVAPAFADPPDPGANPTTLSAQGQGRVIYIRGSGDISPTVQGLRLTNGSIGDLGGAIYAYRAQPIISDCQIYSNTASNGGGVAFWRSDGARLAGNTVYSNTAGGNGGGLFFWDSDATAINIMVTNNVVDGLGGTGAGINVYSSTIQLLHSTLARNRGGAGHGLYVVSTSTVTAANTILVSHAIGLNVGGGPKPSTATLTATLWGTGTWANGSDWLGGGSLNVGTHNLWADPGFADPDLGDYHISPGSAAVNRGIDAGVDRDIDNDPRPDWCFFDIGADELSTGLGCRHYYLPLLLRNTP
jgi:hypothetical protein